MDSDSTQNLKPDAMKILKFEVCFSSFFFYRLVRECEEAIAYYKSIGQVAHHFSIFFLVKKNIFIVSRLRRKTSGLIPMRKLDLGLS